MSFRIIFMSFLAAFLLNACSKDPVAMPESNDPIFRVDGTFGGETISIVAGDNNGFMHTMTNIENGVEVVSGRLEDDALTIELGIYNGGLNNSSEVFDESMNVTPQFSKKYNDPIATLSKDLLINSDFISYVNWSVDGGASILDSVHIHEPGKYNVCATVHYLNGSSPVNLCNEVIIGYNRYENKHINFEVNTSSSSASAWIDNFQGSIDYVDWYYDDVFYVRADSCYKQVTNQLYNLRAEVHYANGVVQTKNMVVDGSVSGRTVEDFTLFEEVSENIMQDYNLKIALVKNGVEYYSHLADNSASEVVITSLELYGLNGQGNQVYKVEANVTCEVSDLNGSNAIPLSFTTSFGFEVK